MNQQRESCTALYLSTDSALPCPEIDAISAATAGDKA